MSAKSTLSAVQIAYDLRRLAGCNRDLPGLEKCGDAFRLCERCQAMVAAASLLVKR